MVENHEVVIKSMVKATVGLTVPSLNLRRIFSKKGAMQKVPYDILEQAIYEPGVEYLFKAGILYIEDQHDRVTLGLEEPDNATIVELTDDKAKEMLTTLSLKDFRAEMEKLSHDQLIEMVQTAIDLGITDYQRCEILRKATSIDVLAAVIERKKDEEEKEGKEN